VNSGSVATASTHLLLAMALGEDFTHSFEVIGKMYKRHEDFGYSDRGGGVPWDCTATGITWKPGFPARSYPPFVPPFLPIRTGRIPPPRIPSRRSPHPTGDNLALLLRSDCTDSLRWNSVRRFRNHRVKQTRTQRNGYTHSTCPWMIAT